MPAGKPERRHRRVRAAKGPGVVVAAGVAVRALMPSGVARHVNGRIEAA
jgi:hypothetical protein